MSMSEMRGIVVPLVTPFATDSSIDVDRLVGHVDRVIEAGVHGVIVAASTGEGLSLLDGERDLLIRTTVEVAAGRVSVLVGCSSNATNDVVAKIDRAAELGAVGAMITHPYYALPDERELLTHYETVSGRVALPVMVYNNPATTGIDMQPEAFAEVLSMPNLVAAKESSGDCTRIPRLRRLVAPEVPLLCGTDNQALEQFVGGADGWVAGVANVIPAQCVALFNLVAAGDLVGAQSLYRRIYRYLTAAELTGKYVQVNRAGLEVLGFPVGPPRQPLLAVDEELMAEVALAVEEANRT